MRDRGRAERLEGNPVWRQTLESGLEWLARSEDAWRDIAARGELLHREQGHPDRLAGEIEELRSELLSE